MTTPIVICDDSSFARQQIARSLPAGWDVDITFAADGWAALDAVRAGKGDILFIDLTMPVLDGFAVLEAIRMEDLHTIAIVVSGDIQPESRQRVQELGAVAFLKKPVDQTELAEALRPYGVLGAVTAGHPDPVSAVDVYDWIQELANVAMGRAADLLSRLVGEHVELSTPRVKLLEPCELDMMLAASGGTGLSLVVQGFIGGGLAGETMLLFADDDVPELARLMHYSEALDQAAEVELLTELENILVGAFLRGLSDQMDVQFSQSSPRIQLHHSGPEAGLCYRGGSGASVLTIELRYALGTRRLACDQLVLLTERSLPALQSAARIG